MTRPRTDALNTTDFHPALTELLRLMAQDRAADSPRPAHPAMSGMRRPAVATAYLSPLEVLALSARPRRTATEDDPTLWYTRQTVDVLSKEGVAFNAVQWFHPLLMTMVSGNADHDRASFAVFYDAAAYASNTLQEILLYQEFPNGERRRIAPLHPRSVVCDSLDIEHFQAARDETAEAVFARRDAAQESYAGLRIGPDAVAGIRDMKAKGAANAAVKRPARVASPISAEKQSQAQRQLEADEVYTTTDPSRVDTARRASGRRRAAATLDGLLAADVPPDTPTAATNAHATDVPPRGPNRRR
jgi:hypothetical protein